MKILSTKNKATLQKKPPKSSKNRIKPIFSSKKARLRKKAGSQKRKPLSLKKPLANPVLEPIRNHDWESWQTFNPAAVVENGRVYLLYRAIGNDGRSAFGYASSADGIYIDERYPQPAYNHVNKDKTPSHKATALEYYYMSGGGWNGGCEDPRITLINDTLFMLYTAFDGWGSVRIALTSISLKDFHNKKWKWKKPVLISPPHEIHKNWVIFPEKINGKYAILHSISPQVAIDYVSDLTDFNGNKYIQSQYTGKAPWKNSWDEWIRGVGPPPIKTKQGWLLLYHAMDKRDPGKYKLGAILLDLKNPIKILYHSKEPILEPSEYYENEGFKKGVIYSCGAVVKEDTLFVYYGGADSVVCVATANFKKFLKDLIQSGKPMLVRTKINSVKK